MRGCFQLIVLVLLINATESSGGACSSGTKNEKCTLVVNHSFCEANLPPEDVEGKETLEEVQAYAKLKHDPTSNLPDSFTICSTIMVPNCKSGWNPIFFTVLDSLFRHIMSPALKVSLDSMLAIDFLTWSTGGTFNKIPPTFPNRWTRSCMSINTASGSINWVVEGVLVMSMESQKLKDSLKLPKDLSGRLILGAVLYGGKWKSVSNKVTNLNIYSASLSVEEMKRMTQDENCAKEGDYLAWKNIEWILHGKARLETVDINEPCELAPQGNLFHAPYPDWASCMHLCENLGSRAPSVTSLEDWITLKTFVKKKIYDRGLNSVQIWLPISDKGTEGVWKDYNGSTIQNYTLPWMGAGPDGGDAQNCHQSVSRNQLFRKLIFHAFYSLSLGQCKLVLENAFCGGGTQFKGKE